jgi:import inner membrane translocase subunit TIM50
MIPFLESIGIYKPEDVRPILSAYSGKDIPLEYAKKEAVAKQKHLEQWQHNKGISAGGFTLSGLFGGSSGLGTSSSSPVPPTYLEQKRKDAQLQYKEEQAYLEAHKADFERLMQQDQQAMANETPTNLWAAINVLQGPPTKGGGPQKEPGSTTSP